MPAAWYRLDIENSSSFSVIMTTPSCPGGKAGTRPPRP